MSSTDLVKAELKARRSSHELEHSLEHLGGKLEEGAMKVQGMRSRVIRILSQVQHPGETVTGLVRSGVSRIPVQRRPVLLAGLAAVCALLVLVFRRRRRNTVPQHEELGFYTEAA